MYWVYKQRAISLPHIPMHPRFYGFSSIPMHAFFMGFTLSHPFRGIDFKRKCAPNRCLYRKINYLNIEGKITGPHRSGLLVSAMFSLSGRQGDGCRSIYKSIVLIPPIQAFFGHFHSKPYPNHC